MTYNNDEGLTEFQELCDYPVQCIYCGKIVMYADPTHHEGFQLPDMICIPCKRWKNKKYE